MLFVWDFRSRRRTRAWHAADALRWVHIASAGVDPVLFPELRDSDVVLTNSRGVFDEPHRRVRARAGPRLRQGLRRLAAAATASASGGIARPNGSPATPALVVGTGPIGRAIARLLRAVGMQVTGAGRRARGSIPTSATVHAVGAAHAASARFDYVVAVPRR